MTSTVWKKLSIAITAVVFIALAIVGHGQALAGKAKEAALVAPFSRLYSLVDLGVVRRLPPAYGGLTFRPAITSTLYIGGLAGTQDAGVYTVRVRRDRDNHITGFDPAFFFAKSPGMGKGGLDAGLTFTPTGDTLLYTSYDDNSMGQIKATSRRPNKQIDLGSIGIESSVGALAFVPKGFAGAGRLKITSYTTNLFYDTTMTADGSGTYEIAIPTKSTKLSGGVDSFIYVKAGNPGFSQDSLLITEYDSTKVSAYTLDANGDPIPTSRRDFITGMTYHSPTALTGTMGATVDPLTGDLLISTFFEDDPSKSRIFAVRGFSRK